MEKKCKGSKTMKTSNKDIRSQGLVAYSVALYNFFYLKNVRLKSVLSKLVSNQ